MLVSRSATTRTRTRGPRRTTTRGTRWAALGPKRERMFSTAQRARWSWMIVERSRSTAVSEQREPMVCCNAGSPITYGSATPAGLAWRACRQQRRRRHRRFGKEAVGKALWDESATGAAVQNGKRFRVFRHAVPRQPQRHQELLAQARPLRLVPLIGVLDVRGSRRPDDDLLHRLRLRMRLRTSS